LKVRQSKLALMTLKTRKAQILALLVVTFLPISVHAQAFFKQSDVFISGRDNHHTYRIPSLICAKNGTLLAFGEGRKNGIQDGVPTDLVMKRSRDRGRTWQSLQILIPTAHGEAYMNPVPVLDGTSGDLFLLVNLYPQPYKDLPADILLIKSTDDGATWSNPVNITLGTQRHELGPGSGIQLHSGRLVVAVYEGIIFSDDHGKTWHEGGRAGGGINETQVVQLANGSLLLNRRATPNRLVMMSKDEGLAWSKPVDDPASAGTDANCQASFLRYTLRGQGYTRDRILFANPAVKDRLNLTVRMSYDEGETWPVTKLVKRGAGAYSSMTILADGSVGLLYETGDYHGTFLDRYARIVFVRFNLEWLSNNQDHLEKLHD
jgi:Neuraminidase (sialidase)